MCWFTLSKFDAFSFVYKKMKRKRLEMEYTLVDEYLTQREADFYNKLNKLNKIKEPSPKDPKKPLLKSKRKTNVTSGNRKSNP